MKLTIFLLTTVFLHVHASGISQSVTLAGRDMSLRTVFATIEQQTGYLVFGSDKLFKTGRPVTLDVKNMPLADLVAMVMNDQPMNYRIEDKVILLSPGIKRPVVSSGPISASFIPVTGIVQDAEGKVLAGATVSVKGKSLFTTTDEKGQFELNANAGDMLVVTFTGYQPAEVRVFSDTRLAVILQLLIKDLTEVTVSTGYQTIAKERSAGSFAKPDMNIVKNRSGSMNILQRLDGLVPGLTINNSPNVPSGGTASPVLIRGLTTIGTSSSSVSNIYGGNSTSRNPLYVVDGIPADDISFVNPQDVADITVLKDATAASIWGSRASNGVIVIVTKKGNANEKIKISYDGFINLQGKPDLGYMPMLNSAEYIKAAREIFEDPANQYLSLYQWPVISGYASTGSTGVAPHELILYNKARGIITAAQANAGLDSLATINNTQQIEDLWYRNASLMNHTLSLSGGSKMHSYYGSVAYTDNRSNRPGDVNNMYKINLRQDFTLNKFIQAYIITDLTNTENSSKRAINIDNNFYPYQLFRGANGANLDIPYMMYLSDSTRISYSERSRIDLNYNPLNELEYGYTRNEGLMSRVISGFTVKLAKGLRFEGTYGWIKSNSRTKTYDDTKSYLVRSELVQFTVAASPAVAPVYYLPDKGGRYTVNTFNQRNWTVRNQLIYDNAWKGRRHQLTMLAGQEAQKFLNTSNRTTVRGYNELLQTSGTIDYAALSGAGISGPVMSNNTNKSVLANTSATNVFNEAESDTRSTSYYANTAYTYNRKYSVNGSWRIDESNLFGKDKSAQNRPVWSTGIKWMISNEDFIDEQISWLDQLAVRVTYGTTGVSPSPGVASSRNITVPGTSAFLPGGVGLSISTPANRSLTWESTKTINIGLDFAILKNRVNGAVDLYRKKTTDLLGVMDVNGFSGYSSTIGNVGDMENKGIELSLNTRNIVTKNFDWSSYFVLSYNKNKITRLNNTIPVTSGTLKITQNFLAGYSAFSLFAYKYAGLDNLGDPQIMLSDKTVAKVRNSTKPEDVEYMGTYQPVWSGGLSNTFRYKAFALSANAVYNLGHVMRKDVNTGNFYGRISHPGNVVNINTSFGGNLSAELKDRWKAPGDENITNVPSYLVNSSLNTSRRDIDYYRYADINVLDASFIKLRDITLSYDLPESFISRLKADRISFRIQVSNIMLWKANKYGIDPEFQNSLTSSRLLPVNQHSITFGANIVF